MENFSEADFERRISAAKQELENYYEKSPQWQERSKAEFVTMPPPQKLPCNISCETENTSANKYPKRRRGFTLDRESMLLMGVLYLLIKEGAGKTAIFAVLYILLF